jgi:uncharacterized protein DUF1653
LLGSAEGAAGNVVDVAADTGIVCAAHGSDAAALFEVIPSTTSVEDFEPLVVYRELFGDYKFWVGPLENFCVATEPSTSARFTPIKAL